MTHDEYITLETGTKIYSLVLEGKKLKIYAYEVLEIDRTSDKPIKLIDGWKTEKEIRNEYGLSFIGALNARIVVTNALLDFDVSELENCKSKMKILRNSIKKLTKEKEIWEQTYSIREELDKAVLEANSE